MKQFLKPTITKIATSVILLFFDYLVGIIWPVSFYNYFCLPIIDMSGRTICHHASFSWPKFLVAIILAYILASLIVLIPKRILKFFGWAILIIIIVGFIILFVGIKF